MIDSYDQLDVRYECSTPRKAYRVSIPGLKVRINDSSNEHQALDISSGGVDFSFDIQSNPKLEHQQEITLSLIIRNRVFLENLKARVVKTGETFAACEFLDIPLRQEALLDKLVLEVQKKMIELQRRNKTKTNSHENTQCTDSQQG